MKQIFNKIDSTFESLFDVVDKNLSRQQTRDLLREFHLQEMPDVGTARSDLFSRRNVIPTNVVWVFYKPNDLAGKVDINIGYPKYIPKFITNLHRQQLLRKLDRFLNKRFGPVVNSGNRIYWRNDNTYVIRNRKETKAGTILGAPYIGVEVFDAKVFPKEKVLEKIQAS
ncbi:MAG: hypothetical protein M1352_00360 [Patescibacteria group bacterium]|nr:hypothetical protein [Patescibacteria group bacterium]